MSIQETRLGPTPFALGAALLRYYPDMTFAYTVKWSTSTDEQVLWNIARAFSASGGRSTRSEAGDRLSGACPLTGG